MHSNTQAIAPTTLARVTDWWASIRTEIRDYRADRAQHRRLLVDLETYTTPTQIDDLLAAVEGSGEQHQEIRDILARNRVEYHRRQAAASRLAG
jgi:hypothetical protein